MSVGGSKVFVGGTGVLDGGNGVLVGGGGFVRVGGGGFVGVAGATVDNDRLVGWGGTLVGSGSEFAGKDEVVVGCATGPVEARVLNT